MAAMVATKVCATVITSSPAPIPSASSVSRRPSVQLLTPTASAVPTNSARCCSKSSICWRMIRSPPASVSRMVVITSGSMVEKALGKSTNLTDQSMRLLGFPGGGLQIENHFQLLQHALQVEPLALLQVLLVADFWVEAGREPDSHQGRMPWHLRQHLGCRPAQSADDAVLLEGDDGAALRRRAANRV